MNNFNRFICRIFHHRDKMFTHYSDLYVVRGEHVCLRCGRVAKWARLTAKGVDREIRNVYMPAIRSSLYAENPLMDRLER